jgi:hypothetical protein
MKPLTLGVILAVSAAAQTYPVAGVVVDGNRNSPLPRARVMLFDEREECRALTTAADGTFRFDVPAGKYALFFERNLWRIEYGTSDPTNGFGSAVIARRGQDTGHLTLHWYPPGAIFGSVVDEEGDPARDVSVQLLRDWVAAGRKSIVPVEAAQTDDRDQYRIGPLPAGTYYVVATNRHRREPKGDGRLRAGGQAPDPGAGYVPIYYPGVVEFRRAEPIALRSGAEKRADIALSAAPAASVRLRCPGWGTEDESCPGWARLFPEGAGGIVLDSLDAVPPGRYTLRFTGDGKTLSKVVDVGSGDMTVDLAVKPQAVVSGKVAFKHAPPKGAAPHVALVDEAGETFQAAIDPDGAFRFTGIAGGKFRPYVNASSAVFIEEMTAEGAAIEDGVLDIGGSAEVRLNIVAGDETGRLKGFAMRGDAPVPEVLVVLAPRNGYFEPLGFQTESDGSFDYETVPAGDYLLFAVDKLDFEYANPEVTRPYLAGAMAVHIPARGVVEQRVPVMAGPGK